MKFKPNIEGVTKTRAGCANTDAAVSGNQTRSQRELVKASLSPYMKKVDVMKRTKKAQRKLCQQNQHIKGTLGGFHNTENTQDKRLEVDPNLGSRSLCQGIKQYLVCTGSYMTHKSLLIFFLNKEIKS